jgi:polyferredoxin
MSLDAIDGFNRSPYNLVVDAKMLLFFLAPSNTTIWVLSFLVIVSFFLRNFWCRFLCPYGALLGLLGLASSVRVARDSEKCIDCKKCEKVCPGSIRVSEKKKVQSAECIGCLECVSVCPVNDCLSLNLSGTRRLQPYLLPILVVSVFLLFWLVAFASGHWQSMAPPENFQKLYKMVLAIKH